MPFKVAICPACGAKLMPTGDVSKARCPCGAEFAVTEMQTIATPDEKRAARDKAERDALPSRFPVKN